MLNKETVNKLLKLAESDGEKQHVKFAIVAIHEEYEFFNDEQLLSTLKQCELNWLEFVRVTGEMRKNLSRGFVESMLNDFAERLSKFNLKEYEMYVIKQSHQIYSLNKQLKEKEDDVVKTHMNSQLLKIL